jgi:hypothetical protein
MSYHKTLFQNTACTPFHIVQEQQRPRRHFERGGALAKRDTFVYDKKSNDFMSFTSRTEMFENMESLYITSEMAFTESLLLQKGHFLSNKRGRSFKKYFFRSLNGAHQPRKKGNFFHFKIRGDTCPIAPRFRGPCRTYSVPNVLE